MSYRMSKPSISAVPEVGSVNPTDKYAFQSMKKQSPAGSEPHTAMGFLIVLVSEHKWFITFKNINEQLHSKTLMHNLYR